MPDWEKFLSAERYARQSPQALLARLPWSPGMRALEVGCGPGFVAVPLAERVGVGGRVVAVDRDAACLAATAERGRGLPLLLLRGDGAGLPLRERSFHRAFLVNVLHEVPEPARVLAQAFLSLEGGGDLVVVDFEARPTSFGPALADRIPAERMASMLSALGGDAERLDVYEDFYAYRVLRS